MEADEQVRVQPLLQRGHRMVDEPAALPDMEPHIIAFGRHAVDVARGNSHQPRQIGCPEFLEPRRRPGGRGGRAAAIDVQPGAVDRTLQAQRVDRLHQIIDRLDLERGDGELIEGGDEHHRRRRRLRGQRAGDVDPVEPRHGNVEQQQVGLQRPGQIDRGFAVAGGADQLCVVGLGEQQLQPLGGERLIVGDEHAQRLDLSHCTRPEGSA